MKGKRHATEQKIRILREVDGGKNIVEVCKEHNISEVTFHRWKRQFGQLGRQRGLAHEGIGAGERRAEEDARGLATEEPRFGGGERKGSENGVSNGLSGELKVWVDAGGAARRGV